MRHADVNEIVRSRLNIVDVISHYIKLQHAGRRYKGLCPFHGEKTPSFFVNEEEQFFHCFGCAKHGNAITFVMDIEHLTFPEALEKIGKEYNIPELLEGDSSKMMESADEKKEIYELNREAALYFHHNLKTAVVCSEYLAGRGIAPETIRRFGVGWSGDGDGLVTYLQSHGKTIASMAKAGLVKIDESGRMRPFFRERVMIPIINQRKQVIGFGGRVMGKGEPKYLNTADTLVFNKRENLFGMNLVREGLRDRKMIIVTEGYFDVMAMHAGGFTTALAALGTAVSSEHLKMLERFGVPVVLLLDGDAAGRRAMRRVIDLEMPEKLDLRVAFIPDEGEDPDSLLKKPDGKERLEKIILAAKPIFQHYLDDLAKRYAESGSSEERVQINEEWMLIEAKMPKNKKSEYSSSWKQKTNAEHEKRPTIRSAEKILQEILYIAATHPSLIPVLEEINRSSLATHDRDGILSKLFALYDEGADKEGYDLIAQELEDTSLRAKYITASEEQSARDIERLKKAFDIIEIDNAMRDLKKMMTEAMIEQTEFLNAVNVLGDKRRQLQEEKSQAIG